MPECLWFISSGGSAPTVSVNETATDGLTTEELLVLREELIDAVQTGSLVTQLGAVYSEVR